MSAPLNRSRGSAVAVAVALAAAGLVVAPQAAAVAPGCTGGATDGDDTIVCTAGLTESLDLLGGNDTVTVTTTKQLAAGIAKGVTLSKSGRGTVEIRATGGPGTLKKAAGPGNAGTIDFSSADKAVVTLTGGQGPRDAGPGTVGVVKAGLNPRTGSTVDAVGGAGGTEALSPTSKGVGSGGAAVGEGGLVEAPYVNAFGGRGGNNGDTRTRAGGGGAGVAPGGRITAAQAVVIGGAGGDGAGPGGRGGDGAGGSGAVVPALVTADRAEVTGGTGGAGAGAEQAGVGGEGIGANGKVISAKAFVRGGDSGTGGRTSRAGDGVSSGGVLQGDADGSDLDVAGGDGTAGSYAGNGNGNGNANRTTDEVGVAGGPGNDTITVRAGQGASDSTHGLATTLGSETGGGDGDDHITIAGTHRGRLDGGPGADTCSVEAGNGEINHCEA